MKKTLSLILVMVMLSVFSALAHAAEVPGKLVVQSSAFVEGQGIPSDFTCDGPDKSPPIAWSGAPSGTRSFAIIVNDPDAPYGNFTHWVLYDLSPALNQLPSGIQETAIIPDGGFQGRSDFGRAGYGGPCPPNKMHRYFFRVFALDKILHLKPGATRSTVLAAMKGHILAEGQLMGTYERS